jgi:drug/metabolite transporter (DMT)-like permease
MWFILTILSIFALATAELMQQHLLNAKNAFDERASAVLTFLVQSLITVPFLFLFGVADQVFSVFDPTVFPRVLLVSLISSVAMIFYLKSFKVKNISISAIFVSFSAIVSTFLGIIFFAESTSVVKFFGIFLILMAIIMANYKNVILEKNHWYGLVAGCIFGICYTFDKSIILDIHPLVYIFWTFSMIAVWGFLLGTKRVVRSLKDKKLNAYKPIFISGVGYFLYNFFTFTAYRLGGEVGRIDAINNSQIFLIILFEFFILKHTQGTMRKILSAGLAVAGVLMLGFAR